MDRRAWRKHTDAIVEDASDLRRAARGCGAHLVGIVGFSGGWHHNPRSDARDIARATLEQLFDRPTSGPVWCVSGATDLGVPSLAYRIARNRGLICVGVTAGAAARYRLAPLDRLVVVGRRFGDESAAFVDLCHTFWMIGGGPQSEAEVRRAGAMGKPVVVVRGLGGRAEGLTLDDVPTATYLDV